MGPMGPMGRATTGERGTAQGRRVLRGLACDATGVALGGCGLVRRAGAGEDAPFAVRPPQQVAAILKLAYGPGFRLALGKRLFLLHLAAQSLGRGKLARARAATEALGLPDIADDRRRSNVALAGAVLKFNPYWSHQTRNRGQWGPGRLAPMVATTAAPPRRQAEHKTDSIDWLFVSVREGGQHLKGYVPLINVLDAQKNVVRDPATGRPLTQISPKSGVTIATGVDLGHMSVADIQALPIDQALKNKLIPYIGLKGQAAQAALNTPPSLTITKEQADQLDHAIREKFTSGIRTLYDKAVAADPNLKLFNDLPPAAQTAIMSNYYQRNDLPGKAPSFWAAVTRQDWKAAARSLRSSPVDPKRRALEAALLDRLK